MQELLNKTKKTELWVSVLGMVATARAPKLGLTVEQTYSLCVMVVGYALSRGYHKGKQASAGGE